MSLSRSASGVKAGKWVAAVRSPEIREFLVHERLQLRHVGGGRVARPHHLRHHLGRVERGDPGRVRAPGLGRFLEVLDRFGIPRSCVGQVDGGPDLPRVMATEASQEPSTWSARHIPALALQIRLDDTGHNTNRDASVDGEHERGVPDQHSIRDRHGDDRLAVLVGGRSNGDRTVGAGPANRDIRVGHQHQVGAHTRNGE